MAAQLHIADDWRDALAAAGLDLFEALMLCESDRCFSMHGRGQTYRIELPGGEAVFVKRNYSTSLKDVCTDLWSLRAPIAPCVSEARALKRMAELDIVAPRLIAWGQRPRLAWPGAAVVVMTELTGQPLDQFLHTDSDEDARRAALTAAGEVTAKIYRAKLSWPDLRPKHIILRDGPAGVLDLARMRPARGLARWPLAKQVRRFCARLKDLGCTRGDIETFLDALQLAPTKLQRELLARSG